MKKLMKALGVVVTFALLFQTIAFASGPNWASNYEEQPLGLYFDGYVQIQSAYNDNGYHAACGYIRYTNGPAGDTGRLYTATGESMRDNTIYVRRKQYQDWWDFNTHPKVTFNYGFTWVPHGSTIWPQ